MKIRFRKKVKKGDSSRVEKLERGHVKALRGLMSKALEPLAEVWGVHINVGNANYTDSNVTFKVSVSLKRNGEILTPEAEEFKLMAPIHGLDPDDLGKNFIWRGEAFTLKGYKRRAKKYPFIGERGDGKKFKFYEEVIKNVELV